MVRKLLQDEFLRRAQIVHGNKYNYDQVNYQGAYTKVKIVCPTHGLFEQKAFVHLRTYGCPKCGHKAKTNLAKRGALCQN